MLSTCCIFPGALQPIYFTTILTGVFQWQDVFSSSDNNFGYSHSDDNISTDDNDTYNNIL